MLKGLNDKQIKEHKLEGYFYKFLNHQLTEDQKRTYRKSWNAQWLLNHNKINFLNQLNNWNQKEMLHIVLLKGSSLLKTYYPDLGSRFMSDIDLLVDSKQHNVLINFLKKEGYSEVISPRWGGNDFKNVYTKGDINIEIHQRLFFHSSVFFSTIASKDFPSLQIFPIEEQFVYLAGHYAFQHNYLKIYWLLDLFHLSKDKIDWTKVGTLAKKFQLKRAVNSCKWILYSKMDSNIAYTKNPLHFFISDQFLTQYNQGGFRYLIIKHFVKDSISTALKYDFFWLAAKIRMLSQKLILRKNIS